MMRFKNNSNHLNHLMLIREFIPRLLLGLFIMLLTVVIQLLFPKAAAYFMDNLTVNQSLDWYQKFAAIIFLVIIAHSIFTSLRYYIFESTGLMIIAKIRRILHQALLSQNTTFYDKHNIGELNNRLSVDVEVLQDTLTMGVAISIRCIFTLFGGLVLILMISPVLSLLVMLFIPVSIILGKWAGKNIRIRSRDIQTSQAICAKVSHDNFSNIRVVHAFNGQEKAQKLYASETEKSCQVSVANTKFLASFKGCFTLILYTALLVTLWQGAMLIAEGSLTIGELTSFILYAGMVTAAADGLSDFWSEWMHTIGATERIFEIIRDTPTTDNQPQKKLKAKGNIEFNNIDFAYPERPQYFALKGFSLSVSSGEKVALVGSSGAGKSTIASLLLGFYKVNQGSIEFDGVPLERLNIIELRKNIAIVEQEPSLFCGSIMHNISYGSNELNPTTADIIKAAKLAHAHNFIEKFPHGYETIVGDRGVQLSGGQKQRIAIARALLREPSILILDEATSALDSSSEYQVQQALNNLMLGRTTIMIAHRLSSIAKADRILVLEQGKIVEQGTHEQLNQLQNGRYSNLIKHQMESFSLE